MQSSRVFIGLGSNLGDSVGQLVAAICAINDLEGTQVVNSSSFYQSTVDLDILLFGEETIDTPDLTVPHYGMAEREFVLVPLFEIAPELIMPDGHPLSVWVSRCSLDGLKRLPSSNRT